MLPDVIECSAELHDLVTARGPVVCLDFDGTLSTIVADPDDATLVEGAAGALSQLAALCPVAIVSGRDLSDVRSRVGIDNLWYAGNHGLELAGPEGISFLPAGDTGADTTLERAASALRENLAGIPGVRVEHKRHSIAVHYRNVDSRHQGVVQDAAVRCARQHGLRHVQGRKVVDLHQDVEWDKGAAVRWITQRVTRGERALPIYVGDDTTDEDVFLALRLSGIAVLVRHDEDGHRATAARYTVRDPDEVCRLLGLLSTWLSQERETTQAWTFTFDGYDPSAEKLREALCTVGNGYLATRGAAPECRAGERHYPGTYVAGIFNRLDDIVNGRHTENESLVNLPNWLPLKFRVDGGDWFDIDAVSILEYHQSMDMRSAVMTRQVRFRDARGRTTSLTQHRFAAMHEAHVAVLSTRVVAEDWSGAIEFESSIDADVRNGGVERYRDLASAHLQPVSSEVSHDTAVLTVRTVQSRIFVAVAVRTTAERDGVHTPLTRLDGTVAVGHRFAVHVAAKQAVSVDKVACIVTGRDVATSEPSDTAVRLMAGLGPAAQLRRAHEVRWSHLWERLDIEVAGYPDELRVLRLHLLHLLQTISPHTADLDVGVPARGLHGEAYRGHVFWDELFIVPVLNLRFPTITRAMLRYRHRRLPEARRAAALAGYAGAMFPWQSGSDGREESPQVHLNPQSGRWNPDPSHLAHHAGIAVAYNVWQYYQASGDLPYLIDFGATLLIEIARFWVSRTVYDKNRGKYSINGVIGPDEFHSGYPDRPHQGVDNNAYTNVMAVWVILRAFDALQTLPLMSRLDLREELALTDAELAHWDDVSRRLFVPFHNNMISQFEGYEVLRELDWIDYRVRYGNIQRLDRILEAEGDDVNRYQAAKQADVLMLLYLLSSDELREILDRLGYRLEPDLIPIMVDYYLARTSHGSTLSAVVNTWVLARANRDRATEFFGQVLASDVADIQGGTTAEGVHLAAMAGSVDLVQRCFTGLETRGDRIVLSPSWPEDAGPLTVSIHYRGQHLHIRVSGRSAEISAACRDDAAPVLIECRGRTAVLSPGQTVAFDC
ncbi:trehalose-phosphatase [Mycobacterium sp. MS1601]|uniref:trehalose-phosphatase n=1 Tax=Mycobacterium sp. MS1601 TaxID=1936029 RepID=UPI0009797AD9|nr:trehalose-phosphatase [Mycobacterium sp. MS1601]AQA05112.1 trehalose-phosphatase [Mycobacterium sp. MS1601]